MCRGEMWSAATCRSFGVLDAGSGRHDPKTSQSGDKSPHSKPKSGDKSPHSICLHPRRVLDPLAVARVAEVDHHAAVDLVLGFLRRQFPEFSHQIAPLAAK